MPRNVSAPLHTHSGRVGQWLLALAMGTCMTLFTLHWPALLEIRGTSLQPYHFGGLFLIAVAALPLWRHVSIVQAVPWVLPYLFHLVLLTPALVGTGRVSMLNRQIFYIAGFFAVAGFCLGSRSPAVVLRRGAILGILSFFLLIEYSAQQMGKSLTTAISGFLASGNMKALLAGFFRPVFNALEPPGEMAVTSALTNTVGGGLLILALCFRAGFRRERRDLVGSSVMLLTVLFLLFMNARSTVLAALGAMLLAFVVRVLRRRGIALGDLVFWGVATTFAVGFVYVAALYGKSIIDTVVTAFTFNDDSTEGRLNQFAWAVGLIEHAPVGGSGYIPTPSGRAIHNLFLSAWAYGGLFNFVLVVLFYGGLLWAWVRWLGLITTRHEYWTLDLRPEWVAALPILPLLRVWLSGDAGHLPFSEWVALGIFSGLVIRNEFAAGRAGRARVAGRGQPRSASWSARADRT